MKKNYFLQKNLNGPVVCFALLMLTSAHSFSQTVYKDCQDGKVYFKVKDNVSLNARTTNGKVDIASLSFMKGISSTYKVASVDAPFASMSAVLDKTFRIDFSDIQNVDKIIADLYKTGMVEYAERVPLDELDIIKEDPFMSDPQTNPELMFTPNDPNFATKQGNLTTIKASLAWDYSKGDPSITIAVVDGAVQVTHTDLKDNAWVNPGEVASNNIDDDANGYKDDINGWDAADNDNDPNPGSTAANHGTHCAGIAAAQTNNGTGIASISYNCSLIGVKAAAGDGSGSFTAGYTGITYASKAPARVITCSWGSYTFSQTNQNVIDAAYARGSIIFATAGNDNQETKRYPCGYNNVYCVAATTNSDVKSSYSNYGAWVDVASPGDNVYSSVPNNTYMNMSGTSMACPLVAGLAGLMLSVSPSMTQTQILNCITSSVVNIDSKNANYVGKIGAGRINAEEAMKCVTTLTTGMKSLTAAQGIKVFPNPCTGTFYLEKEGSDASQVQVEISNMMGEKVKTFTVGNNQGAFQDVLDISSLDNGMYIISVVDGENKAVSKIIKQ